MTAVEENGAGFGGSPGKSVEEKYGRLLRRSTLRQRFAPSLRQTPSLPFASLRSLARVREGLLEGPWVP
ncbi:hypothetical protein ACFWMR_40300, partial [Amycolatopsis thailandensis]|uniref:hypothetical protein n=1 Tax=Amycolatopsis thailandensis TaxID=589330 RepID=UPI00364B4DFC